MNVGNRRRQFRTLAPQCKVEKIITTLRPRPDWVDLLAVVAPLPLLIAIVAVPEPLRPAAIHWLGNNWGNLASVWGLGVSVYVLWVAKGARTAANRATVEAEHAAQAARYVARTRGALEDLQVALGASRQVSQHAGAQNWQIVKLKAEEVMESCRIILNRWEDTPALKDSRNSLNQAAALMRTIAMEASKTAPNLQRVVKTQLDAHDHISSVEGKVQQEQDLRSA